MVLILWDTGTCVSENREPHNKGTVPRDLKQVKFEIYRLVLSSSSIADVFNGSLKDYQKAFSAVIDKSMGHNFRPGHARISRALCRGVSIFHGSPWAKMPVAASWMKTGLSLVIKRWSGSNNLHSTINKKLKIWKLWLEITYFEQNNCLKTVIVM